MKTDQLVQALAADLGRPYPAMRHALAVAMLAGLLGAVVIFAFAMGPRSDVGAALATWRFDWKLALVAIACALAFVDCARLSDPLASGLATRLSLAIPALVLGGLLAELLLIPPAEWMSRLVGNNAAVCLIAIPLLALAPLTAGLAVMRRGAPASPVQAGAAVGRLAAAVGAMIYAVHCTDDSPLFVVMWYGVATAAVMALGALAGRFVLRW